MLKACNLRRLLAPKLVVSIYRYFNYCLIGVSLSYRNFNASRSVNLGFVHKITNKSEFASNLFDACTFVPFDIFSVVEDEVLASVAVASELRDKWISVFDEHIFFTRNHVVRCCVSWHLFCICKQDSLGARKVRTESSNSSYFGNIPKKPAFFRVIRIQNVPSLFADCRFKFIWSVSEIQQSIERN